MPTIFWLIFGFVISVLLTSILLLYWEYCIINRYRNWLKSWHTICSILSIRIINILITYYLIEYKLNICLKLLKTVKIYKKMQLMQLKNSLKHLQINIRITIKFLPIIYNISSFQCFNEFFSCIVVIDGNMLWYLGFDSFIHFFETDYLDRFCWLHSLLCIG